MPNAYLPEDWLLRIERELGQRSAVAAIIQALGYLLFRASLGKAGPVALAADVAGASILLMMAARVGLFWVQRRKYPEKLSRTRWTFMFRLFFCGGGAAWGALSAVILESSGVGFFFFISVLINIGICGLVPQNVGLDLLLVRLFVPLIMGPPIVVALLHLDRSGYLVLAVLLSLFVAYQLILARRTHALLVEALGYRVQIEAQKDQLAALVEAIPGFVIWTDAQGGALGMNQRSHEELGEEASRVIADSTRRFVASGAEDAFEERLLETSKGERSHLLAFRRWKTVEGDRVVVTALDIEARKEAEREVEVARMHALESARLGALGTMAAGIAHEINNPLQVLRYASGQLTKLLHDHSQLSAKALPVVERMDRTVDRMASIVAGLRSFARDGQSDPVESVGVAGLVQEVTELVRTSRAMDATELRVGSIRTDLVIPCRRTELGQVLVNLLANAFDAVKPLRERWVYLDARDLGSEMELSVTDSGHGIPPDLVGQIMNPFFTTKVGAGTGLGLSISRSIVIRHNGSLTVDPYHPHTRFVIRLPKYVPSQMMAAPPSAGTRH